MDAGIGNTLAGKLELQKTLFWGGDTKRLIHLDAAHLSGSASRIAVCLDRLPVDTALPGFMRPSITVDIRLTSSFTLLFPKRVDRDNSLLSEKKLRL